MYSSYLFFLFFYTDPATTEISTLSLHDALPISTRASNAVAKDRRAEIYHHPLEIVRAALDPGAKLTSPRTAGREQVVDITTANGLAFTLAIDATTKLPTWVVSATDNTNLGDVLIETAFDDYQDLNGLK